MMATLVGLFGALALLLAVLGLYGVMAHAAPERTPGIGTRYIEAQLFGVAPTDPLTLVGGCGALAIAGLIASVIPALRATRVDPIIALRRP